MISNRALDPDYEGIPEQHYVSPKTDAEAFVVFEPKLPYGYTGAFSDSFVWCPAPAAGSDVQDAGGNKVKVKRNQTEGKKIVLQIKRKSNPMDTCGTIPEEDVCDTMNVWIVWATGSVVYKGATAFTRLADQESIDGTVADDVKFKVG